MASLSFANGVGRTTTFDLDYRQTNLKDQGKAAIENLTYAYDANSNVTGITDAVHSYNSQTMTYDNMDRLLSAKSGAGGYGSLSWTYDPNGNRLTETNGTTATYAYASGSNRLASLTTNSSNFGFNGAGENTTVSFGTYLNLTYNYDHSERLYQPVYSGYGSPSSTSLYAGDGQRTSKAAAVFTVYKHADPVGGPDGDGRLLEEGSPNGSASTDYIYLDGQPIAEYGLATSGGKTTEATYFIHADRLGTPQTVTDGSQSVKWSATYLPFGLATTTGSVTQNLRFPGQYYDIETGLYHNGFRDYDPTSGRYIESDPIGLNSGSNTYVYASNHPTTGTD